LETLHQLPEEIGVYYFHDKNGNIVYVGKSINIKKRVVEHFTAKTNKAAKLQQYVHDITFEKTGSELVALLFESHEIKRLQPSVNRAQRKKFFPYVLFEYENQLGYRCLSFAKVKAKDRAKLNILRAFPNLNAAKGMMRRLIEQFELCQSLCSVDNTGGPCFYYQLHKCKGACVGEERPEDYNERIELVIDAIKIDFEENFFIIDQGRSNDEHAIVLVEDGIYKGFGYASPEEIDGDIDMLKDCIKRYKHHPEIVRIIRTYMSGKKKIKVLEF